MTSDSALKRLAIFQACSFGFGSFFRRMSLPQKPRTFLRDMLQVCLSALPTRLTSRTGRVNFGSSERVLRVRRNEARIIF